MVSMTVSSAPSVTSTKNLVWRCSFCCGQILDGHGGLRLSSVDVQRFDEQDALWSLEKHANEGVGDVKFLLSKPAPASWRPAHTSCGQVEPGDVETPVEELRTVIDVLEWVLQMGAPESPVAGKSDIEEVADWCLDVFRGWN